MRKSVLIAAALLSACAGTPRPPAVVATVVEADRPVAVACVKREDIPAMPDRVGAYITGDAVFDGSLTAESAIALRRVLDKALALLGACAG